MKTIRRILIIASMMFSVITALLFTSCGSKEEAIKEIDSEYFSKVIEGIKYDTATVTRGTLYEKVSEDTMDILPTRVKEFKFNFDGYVNEYHVKANKILKKGDLIAELDDKKISHDIMMQQFKVERQQVIYNQMKTKGQNEKEIKVQELEVKIQEEKLKKLLKDKEKHKIYAPVNCYITDFYVRKGNSFKAGETLFKASYSDKPIIKTAYAANLVKFENINIGDSAVIRQRYGEYEVKVCFISSRNDYGRGGSIFFTLDDESSMQGSIYEKIVANAEFESKELKNKLIVPELAVKRNGGIRYVEILKDGSKKIRYVDCGTVGKDENGVMCYEVLSGLKEGDVVILGIKNKLDNEI
ncbi:efflux RND transporter periplasmic adaptor subunit [Oceanirhabdus sp. W0125-5]|uniref:efflux RND transporter periplasmic adaptor subunit n=1 Tax=Oceanirhabdus sp. W0125-5 TaxID=2999116 RepID=UPI0022F32B45|nr:efflux RND transporter periplasmic adaptor subunit [Oceanirhabdus sp. W0125-5]WBW97833.1 efflux RND transporter periplasmic adaptor subunit [Oceanirhabdus sp. W0125-5]